MEFALVDPVARPTEIQPSRGGRSLASGLFPLGLALWVLVLPALSGADEVAAKAPACPSGLTRSSGEPERAVFTKAASVGVLAHWCERYDEWGATTRSGPYWETYSSGSIRLRASYVESRIEGPVLTFYESGGPFLRGTLADGRWTDSFEILHENGTPWLRAAMNEGRLDGLVETFFPGGELESQARFQSGREDGLSRSFFPAAAGGGLKSEARIEGDLFIGEQRIFDRDGGLVRMIDWDTQPIEWSRGGGALAVPASPGPGEPDAAAFGTEIDPASSTAP